MGRKKRLLLLCVLAVLLLYLGAGTGWGGALSQWLDRRAAAGQARAAAIALGETAAPESAPAEPEETPDTVAETAPAAETVPPAAEGTDPAAGEAPTMTPDGVAIQATTIAGGLKLNNATSYDLDVEALLAEELPLKLPAEGPQILIIHTHGSEAYAQEAADPYVESDPYRTQDPEHSVIRVGQALADVWTAAGLSVIHDTAVYDYPSYSGSYTRSGAAVEAYLAEYPNIAVVIDLHRDALGTDPIYKVVADSDTPMSQLMLLAATGENGLYHPNWRENLKLAVHFQAALVEQCPTLARPIAVKQERYNQHLTTGSLILEVGTTGNTLGEAVAAAETFGEATAPFLLSLVS